MTKQDGREASIRIRLSANEKAKLENLAWRAKTTVSQYIRQTLKLKDPGK